MKKILVVNDFSIAADNAVSYARKFASLNEAKIFLYETSVKNRLSYDIISLDAIIPENYKSGRENGVEINYSKNGNAEVKLLAKKNGLMEEILSIQKKEHIDLVIIGIKETVNSIDSQFTNIITDLIKVTLAPILIIPERSRFKTIEKIAFTIDFKLEKELEMHNGMKDLLKMFNPEVFVLNVVKKNEAIGTGHELSEYNTEKYFENINHLYSFIQSDNLINGLKEFVSQNKIDMITMLPHKHNLLRSMFIDSNTEAMALRTNVPLIIFPINN